MSFHLKTTNLHILILLISSLLVFSSPNKADHPIFTNCSSSPNYTFNSSFQINLNLLLKSLPSKTSLSDLLFYNTSMIDTTHADDSVYVLGLCRGDVTPEVCRNCIGNASRGIVQQCPNGKDAFIFYELCQLRYSYQNFFSTMDGKYYIPTWNNSKQNILDQEEYNLILSELMKNLSNSAAFDPNNGMFAKGYANLTRTEKLYGLVQCTKDLSEKDCNKCLRGAIIDIVGCCSMNQGGIVVDKSCSSRHELYLFYHEGVVRATPSPPASFFDQKPALPPANETPRRGNKSKGSRVAIIAGVLFVVVALMGSWFYYQYHRKRTKTDQGKSQIVLLQDFGGPNLIELPLRRAQMHDENQMDNDQDFPFMDLPTIKVATDNFSISNKLGEGGSGTVYKGRLLDGKEIAVKRLSRRSSHGLEEFKNEVILIARVQHRNLVKLLGYGIEGEEKLLIYEFMPNKSLDLFIYDETKRSQLDWKTRYKILVGIARGLLYLHEDSRLKIIHRDLKPNNVLLDNEMNAKISDFGMARIFDEHQSQANTKRVVGT